MKPIMSVFLTFLCMAAVLTGRSQKNVVLLVDVSGSIPHIARNQVREVIKDVLMGRAISDPSFYYEKDPQSSLTIPGAPLVSNGSHVLLIPFGEKNTSDTHYDIVVANYPQDLTNFIDAHYPASTDYKDQFTYLTLARAKAAQAAKQLGMTNFMLLLISDNINDFTGGSSPNYSSYEQELVDDYNSKSNPVAEAGIEGYVKLRGNRDFKIPLRMMDVSLYKSAPTLNGGNGSNGSITPDPTTPTGLSIEFAGSLSAATRKKPAVIKSGTVNISWLCKNCPDNTLYSVIVSEVEGGKFRDANSKNISSPSVTKNLESGTYKITVSGEVPAGATPVGGAVTYVTVDTDSGLGWLWLVVLVLLIVAGIYWNKQNQQKKIREAGKEQDSLLDSNKGKTNYREDQF